MATPVGRNVGECLETMRDTMIDLLLVRVGFIVGLANTLGDDLGVTFPVTGVLAVGTLHTGSVLEEVSAQSAAHDVVELLRDELVALLFVDLFLFLTDGTLSVETNVKRTPVFKLLGWIKESVRSIKIVHKEILPKLIVKWILPTGSSANHESIITGGAEAPGGAPPAPCPWAGGFGAPVI